MNKLKSALEMRKETLDNQSEEVRDQIDTVMNFIQMESNKGLFSFISKRKLLPTTIVILEDKGYKIYDRTNINNPSEILTQISW